MSASTGRRRRFLAPEVVQTSAMDCGPATLKCLLEGFGISVSYGRLREACQTDVDGTSIDTMEELMGQLGLEAEQIMMPLDHLLLDEAQALPAVVVVRMPNGLTHFVVLWRRHGPFVQVMDPGTGRRWVSGNGFLEEVYSHTFPLAASYWREWAGSTDFLAVLRRRLAHLKLSEKAVSRVVERALSDPGWRSLAVLDAAARMIDSIVRARGLRAGKPAESVLESFVEECRTQSSADEQIIPDAYWSVQAGPPGPTGEERVLVRGAVLIRVVGRKAARPPATGVEEGPDGAHPLSPELTAALEERPSRPGRELRRLLRMDGLLTPTALFVALAAAAAGVVLEALLFRGVLDLGRDLHLAGQRLAAISALILFALALLFLEFPIATTLLRMGRRLEIRLRIAFLDKIPRLVDRYFQSRLTSDMAERSHLIHTLRLWPELAGGFIRSNFELLFTTAGIIWLYPASAPIALLAALLSVGLPLLVNPLLTEQDLRLRTHVGALSRFYLDALLGLVAVRAHGAERAIRSEHESLLVEWSRAGLALQRTVVRIEGLQAFLGFGLAAWLLLAHLGRGVEPGGVLLLVYWALNLPVIGQEIALLARQYPAHRNVTLRILEPLGAAEAPEADLEETSGEHHQDGVGESARNQPSHKPATGVAIALEQVGVRAAGHTILEDIDLTIVPGSHVAVVGSSGAGKSSLAGLLLGWHRPAAGRVLIDGQPLDSRRLKLLRQETAWVDPAVQLWNRSFLANLRYGAPAEGAPPIGWVIEQAHLLKVLESLPDGMQTPLGEGGGLVSGGEGQRIRFGRALLRSAARLVILDEPFRGLDRERRSQLLAKAREAWSGATLLCITHDIGETQAFERVLVIDRGRIVEDGAPGDLLRKPASQYKALLESEDAVRQTLWANELWRRQWLEDGKLTQRDPSTAAGTLHANS